MVDDIIDGLDRAAVEAQQRADYNFEAGNHELHYYYLGAVYAYHSTALQLREMEV
jgi:hypothetical protein